MSMTLTYTPPGGQPETRKFHEWGIHPHWQLTRSAAGNSIAIRLQHNSKAMAAFRAGGKIEVLDHSGKIIYSGELEVVPTAIFKTDKGHLLKFKT